MMEPILIGHLMDANTGRAVSGSNLVVDAFSCIEPGVPIPTELSTAEGKFVLSGLGRGEYIIVVRTDGYAPMQSRVEIPACREARFELEALGEVRIRITDQYARRLKTTQIRLAEGDELEGHDFGGHDPDPGGIDEKGEGAVLISRYENGYHVVEGLSEGIKVLEIEVPGYALHQLEALVDLQEPRSYWLVLE